MQLKGGTPLDSLGAEDTPAAHRAELEFVASALARCPRLAALLRYLGGKALNGEADSIREYTIATDVFGRPKTFDSGEDAIARVEAHRLRKKLKEFYEREGRDRPIRILLPQGTYVPLFEVVKGPERSTDTASATNADEIKNQTGARGKWLAALLLTVLCGLGGYRFVIGKNPSPAALQTSAQPPIAPNSAEAIHILAGYYGQPRIDNAGVVWTSDVYSHGCRSMKGPEGFIARTTQPMLFQLMREGECSYQIPLRPGVYELHLYFVEMSFGPGLETGGELNRTFSVLLNGKPILPGFDIESDAMGGDVADEKVFRDVEPAADGRLHLSLQPDRGQPVLSAIAILPGVPYRQLPVRLVTQQTPYIDHRGQFWSPDNYFWNGVLSPQRKAVEGTVDPGLYARERFGHFSYVIPVDVRDRYTVTLHFAEFFFGPKASGMGGIGSRRFNVYCNGTAVLRDFDVFRTAGSYTAITKTFRHIQPTPQGKLNLTFEPITNYATVSAIEVEDENE